MDILTIQRLLSSMKTETSDDKILLSTVGGSNTQNWDKEVIHFIGGGGSSSGGSVSIIVDPALSLESINPVQNKVITKALKDKQSLIKNEDIITPQEVSELFKGGN